MDLPRSPCATPRRQVAVGELRLQSDAVAHLHHARASLEGPGRDGGDGMGLEGLRVLGEGRPGRVSFYSLFEGVGWYIEDGEAEEVRLHCTFAYKKRTMVSISMRFNEIILT